MLALLSENKVILFNDSIIKLMQLLVAKGWSASEETADYGAFLLDKMHIFLDPKKMPYIDLTQLFTSMKNRENEEEFTETRDSVNYMR